MIKLAQNLLGAKLHKLHLESQLRHSWLSFFYLRLLHINLSTYAQNAEKVLPKISYVVYIQGLTLQVMD